MNDLKIIRPQSLANEILGVSVQTLYRWHAEDKIPIEKIKFGPNCAGYRKKDVEAWLNGDLESLENRGD